MNRSDKVITGVLIGLLVLLAGAYVYGVSAEWEGMLERPVRISYFLADLLVLYPLGIMTILGMIRRTDWRYRTLWLTLGVLLFDMAHQMIYLFRDNYFGAPLAIPVLLFALIVGFTLYSLHATYHRTTGEQK